MKKNKLLPLLLAAGLILGLTACSGGEQRGSSSSGEESSSQTADPTGQDSSAASQGEESTSRNDPVMAAPTTQDEVAEYFKQALLTGNLTGIQYITNYNGYEDWANVKFSDIEYQTIAQDFESARYSFTFHVQESGSSTFPLGSVKRIVSVGYPAYGDHLGVTMLYDEKSTYYELFPYDMEQPGYAAYSQVIQYVNFMNTREFATTAEIPADEVAEYAIIQLSQEYQGERGQFAVSEVNEMVGKLFGLTGFDASQSRFYNADEKVCELLGRGGNVVYTTTQTASYDTASGTYALDMTFYSDPLCTIKDRTVRYTLKQNGNTLQFVSAVQV